MRASVGEDGFGSFSAWLTNDQKNVRWTDFYDTADNVKKERPRILAMFLISAGWI